MKKLLSLLLVLATTVGVMGSLSSCFFFTKGNDMGGDDPTVDGTTPDSGTKPDDGTKPDGTKPDGTKPDGTKPDGTTPDDGTKPDDSTTPSASRAEDYAYTPYLPSTMPRININTASGNNEFAESITTYPNHKWDLVQYEGCDVTVTNCAEQYALTNIAAQIKVRGNYTIIFPKKPFRIKFVEKQNLLGMNDGQAYKSWVLLSEWKDSSMLFDATAYYLGNTILGSDGYYCTDFRLVELYLNNVYWGVYLLAEQQSTGTGRVDINEPEVGYTGTDIGYFFEYDGYWTDEAAHMEQGGNHTFTISHAGNAALKEQDGNGYTNSAYYRGYTIKSDIYSTDQVSFLKKYVDSIYYALYNTIYLDKPSVVNSEGKVVLARSVGIKTDKEAVEAVIDLQSLVDTYILNEICCDYDLHWSSFYMSLDLSATGNKKLTFCAPWDFDTAFGSKNSEKYMNRPPDKSSNKDACESGTTNYAGNNRNPWLIMLIHEEWFLEMVKEKWAELITYDVLDKSLRNIGQACYLYNTKFSENAAIRWYYPNGKCYLYQVGDPSPSGELIPEMDTYRTQQEAADRLRAWLKLRYNYLNTQWGDGEKLF